MLTKLADIERRTEGLDCGADDYLPKPFSLKELSARIRAILRRAGGKATGSIFVCGPTSVDVQRKTVTKAGRNIHLVPAEFKLLEFLISHGNEVFTVDALLNRVWSTSSEAGPDAVRVAIRRIRSLLDDEGEPSIIETVHGLGYRLRSSDSSRN